MDMTPERWAYTGNYAEEVFGRADEHLAGLMDRAVEAGLPGIAVSADVGRLLHILVSMTEGHLAIELGTLGGYSGIWIARGLTSPKASSILRVSPTGSSWCEAQRSTFCPSWQHGSGLGASTSLSSMP
jgi:predicted O-methyltransferase YrrM